MANLIFIFAVFLMGQSCLAGANDWLPIKTTSDGIKAEKKEVPGSAVLAFRGEGIVDAPLTKVATIIFDTKRAPEWIVDLEFSKIVKWLSPSEWVEYDHINTPPIIMKDRDFVSKVNLNIDAKAKSITFLYSNTTDPEAPETKFIRGDLMNTTFLLQSIENDQKTHVVGEIHCDPKGSVAKWIVNYFQSDWPIDTIRNLRKQAAKPDVKNNEKIVALFNTASEAPTTNNSSLKK